MIGRWNKPPVVDDEQPRGFDDYELKLGDTMRGERATLGKSLLDVQRELKIKATYIAAIENADPSVFETQGFIAGYVRSYARYLELDPDWAFKRFCEESGFQVAHGMSPEASARKQMSTGTAVTKVRPDPFADANATFIPRDESIFSRIEPGALGSTAVLLLLVAGLGYGAWSVFQEIQRVDLAPVDQAPGVIADVEPFTPPATDLAALDDTAQIEAPSAEALDRLYRPQALDLPVLVPRDGPIATLDPQSFGTLVAESRPSPLDMLSEEVTQIAMAAPLSADEVPVQVVEEAKHDLTLIAVRPSWVRVQSADGSILLEKILDAGESYIVPATEEPPVLRTGNAGGVYFSVKGEAYGPIGKAGVVVKNVALSMDAVSDSYDAVDLAQNGDVAEMFRVAMNTVTEDPTELTE